LQKGNDLLDDIDGESLVEDSLDDLEPVGMPGVRGAGKLELELELKLVGGGVEQVSLSASQVGQFAQQRRGPRHPLHRDISQQPGGHSQGIAADRGGGGSGGSGGGSEGGQLADESLRPSPDPTLRASHPILHHLRTFQSQSRRQITFHSYKQQKQAKETRQSQAKATSHNNTSQHITSQHNTSHHNTIHHITTHHNQAKASNQVKSQTSQANIDATMMVHLVVIQMMIVLVRYVKMRAAMIVGMLMRMMLMMMLLLLMISINE